MDLALGTKLKILPLQTSIQNKIILLIGLASFVLAILAKLQLIPYYIVEPLDYLTLGLSIYGLNIPKIVLGTTVRSVCSLPYVGMALLAFSPLSNPFHININGIVMVGILLISMVVMKKNIDWSNPGYKLKKRLESALLAARNDDPEFDTCSKQPVFWFFSFDKKEIVKMFFLFSSIFPTLWGIACLSLLFKLVDLAFPTTITLSILLITFYAMKISKNNTTPSRPIQFLSTLWDQKDKVEDSAQISVIKKLGSPNGALYLMASIGGIFYSTMGLIQVLYGPSSIFNLSINYHDIQSLSIVLGIVGTVIIILLPFSYSILLFISKKKTRLPTNHFLWIIASTIVAFTGISWNNSLPTILQYASTQFPTSSNGAIGLIGLGTITHLILAIKLKKTSFLTKTTEKRIAYCLFPFLVVTGTHFIDFPTLLSLSIFPLVWFAIIQFSRRPYNFNNTKRNRVIGIVMIVSILSIGTIMLLSRQYYNAIPLFFVSLLFYAFYLPKQKRDLIFQKIFGMKEKGAIRPLINKQ